MTNKQIDKRIYILRNKIERATTKYDPTGQVIAGLKAEIAQLERARPLPMNGTDNHQFGEE